MRPCEQLGPNRCTNVADLPTLGSPLLRRLATNPLGFKSNVSGSCTTATRIWNSSSEMCRPVRGGRLQSRQTADRPMVVAVRTNDTNERFSMERTLAHVIATSKPISASHTDSSFVQIGVRVMVAESGSFGADAAASWVRPVGEHDGLVYPERTKRISTTVLEGSTIPGALTAMAGAFRAHASSDVFIEVLEAALHGARRKAAIAAAAQGMIPNAIQSLEALRDIALSDPDDDEVQRALLVLGNVEDGLHNGLTVALDLLADEQGEFTGWKEKVSAVGHPEVDHHDLTLFQDALVASLDLHAPNLVVHARLMLDEIEKAERSRFVPSERGPGKTTGTGRSTKIRN